VVSLISLPDAASFIYFAAAGLSIFYLRNSSDKAPGALHLTVHFVFFRILFSLVPQLL
jgi:hypothetical protein